jgi:hypothetical protein
MQYYTPCTIAAELAATGFIADGFLEMESGEPWHGGATPFFVIARREG